MTDIKQSLDNLKLFLLDMDGTIYLGERLFDGVLEFLEHVRSTGGRCIFLTNNSSRSVAGYVDKLQRLGLTVTADDFVTSTNATVLHLKSRNYTKIYALGTASFKEQLREANLPVTDRVEEDVDCLCMGFDTEQTFQKLTDSCVLLGRGG